jgi:hypothetical protein
VTFEPGSRLKRIRDLAFRGTVLKEICIPASVQILDVCCFSTCRLLSRFTFECGSRLTTIRNSAFTGCSGLPEICIPPLLASIPEHCFFACTSLARLSFEPGSKLKSIAPGAFNKCHSLTAITIPGQLESFQLGIFMKPCRLSQLTFEMPSKLRCVELPPANFGAIEIPDSVEVLSGPVDKRSGQSRVVEFGRESKLIGIRTWNAAVSQYGSLRLAGTLFMRLSEGALRRFRSRFQRL